MTRVVAVLLLLACCRKDNPMGAELSALSAAGHTAADFASSEPRDFQAAACQSGTLDKIPAVLCRYDSADALAQGQQRAEAWLGQAPTGVILRRDLYLLILSDRDRIDPNGRVLAALSHSFRRK